MSTTELSTADLGSETVHSSGLAISPTPAQPHSSAGGTLPGAGRAGVQAGIKSLGASPRSAWTPPSVSTSVTTETLSESSAQRSSSHEGGTESAVPAEGRNETWFGARMLWSKIGRPALKRVKDRVISDPMGMVAAVASTVVGAPRRALEVVGNFALNQGERALEHVQKNGILQTAGDLGSGIAQGLYAGFGIKALVEGRVIEGVRSFIGELSGLSDLKGIYTHGKQALILYGRYSAAEPGSAEAALLKMQMLMELRDGAICAVSGAGAIAAIGAAGVTFGGSMLAYQAGRATLKKVATLTTKALLKGTIQNTAEIGAKIGAKHATTITTEVVENAMQASMKQVGKAVHPAEAIADASISKCATIAREGGPKVLTPKHVADVVAETTSDYLKPLLRESPAFRGMLDEVEGLFASATSPELLKGKLTEMGIEMGLTKGQSKRLARELDKLVRNGASSPRVREALEEGLSTPLAKELASKLKPQFTEAFSKGVDGPLMDVFKDIAKKQGKELDDLFDKGGLFGKKGSWSQYADEVKKAGDEGFERGVKNAVKDAVREGMEEALQKIRAKRFPRARMGAVAGMTAASAVEISDERKVPTGGTGVVDERAPQGQGHGEELSREGGARPNKYREVKKVNLDTGESTIRYQRFNDETHEWDDIKIVAHEADEGHQQRKKNSTIGSSSDQDEPPIIPFSSADTTKQPRRAA